MVIEDRRRGSGLGCAQWKTRLLEATSKRWGVSICEGMTGRGRVMVLKRLVVSRMEEEKKKLKKPK